MKVNEMNIESKNKKRDCRKKTTGSLEEEDEEARNDEEKDHEQAKGGELLGS